MKDSLIIDGRIYISSRRGAEISRYSNDYIGQLCRGGKVPAQMMGRTWFVDQEALLKHKKDAEEAFQARCRAASREQQRVFAMSTTIATAVLPSCVGSSPFVLNQTSLGNMTTPLMRLINTGIVSNHHRKENSLDTIPFRRSLTVALIAVIMVTGGFILEKNSSVISRIENSSQVAHVYASTERIIDAIGSGFDHVLAFFGNGFSRQAKYAVNTVDRVETIESREQSWNGMAVVPSGSGDDETKDRIRNSFSDVVKVMPDQSGTAGVITPVFRETSGEDFIYVLVPVKEEKK